MEIVTFELVDLGPGAEGYFDEWGPSFNDVFDSSIIGSGSNAREAFEDALNRLAFEGYDTKLLHEAGIEFGLHSQSALTPAADIEPHVEPEEDDEPAAEPLLYHFGIRFELPEAEEAYA